MDKKKEFRDISTDILEKAKVYGLDSDHLFITTFERYEFQLSILQQLKEEINKTDVLVTKEYVKGRENVYTNPAIGEYNKTATAANNTATILLKIISSLKPDNEEDAIDKEFFK